MVAPSLPVQRQFLFFDCIVQLFAFVAGKGWKLTFADVGVSLIRKGYNVKQQANGSYKPYGPKVLFQDAEHMSNSTHYERLGGDFNLWVPDVAAKTGWRLIAAGGSKEWKTVGEFWESRNPLCNWGGRFNDDNHLSILSPGGKK